MTFLEIILILVVFCLVLFVLVLLFRLTSTVNARLGEVKGSYVDYLSNAQNLLSKIVASLSELKNATNNILTIGQNIHSLQDILKPPKLRGAFSEILLENSLSQVLPQNYYEMYYKFQSGSVVDAIVKLKDSKLLPIDAKFPLDSIKDYLLDGTKNNNEAPGQFIRDVKKHIDSISGKYILPKEGTLDFALMYIPAENVYYEIILKEDRILQYAKEKHVIPVSPISLYSYLSIILIGLKGIEIEQNASYILSKISDLRNVFKSFITEYNTLGFHITNAKSKYDESRELILKLSQALESIELIDSRK